MKAGALKVQFGCPTSFSFVYILQNGKDKLLLTQKENDICIESK